MATTESSPYWAVGAAAISGVASENEPFFKKIWKYFFVPNNGLAFKSKRFFKKLFFIFFLGNLDIFLVVGYLANLSDF